MKSKKAHLFNRLSFATLLATIFLSLFFFVPYTPVTLEASKGFLVSVGMTLALFFWLIACLVEGKVVIPRDRLILFAGLIPIVFLISSFFSSSFYVSLFGTGFETGTFGSILVLFILFFLSAIHFQTERRVWYFYQALFFGALLVALFQIVNMFAGIGGMLPGFFQGMSFGNLIGGWSDFAFFFGLVIIIAVSAIEFLKTKILFRIGHYILLVSGLFFLAIINIPLVWLLVGLSSIIVFIYSISATNRTDSHNHARAFPAASLLVILVSLVFLIGSSSLGNLISQHISVYNPDIRPSFASTAHVAWQAITDNPLLGSGPNTFAIDWALWQPKAFAQTSVWNMEFTSGVSLLSTFAATTGILGIVSILLFLVVFIIRGIQSLRIAFNKDNPSHYFLVVTFSTALYAWITVILFTPNIIMLAIAFATSGMLIGILVNKQAVRIREFSFLGDPRGSFFTILGLMIMMIASISLAYVYAEKFASVIYFSRSLASDGTPQSLAQSEKMLANAIILDKNDLYYRALSQVYVQEIGTLVNDTTVSQDTLKSTLQNLLNLAQQNAEQAIMRNPKHYLNYVNLGNVYSSLVPLGVAQSYEGAKAAYIRASELAPNNPAIYLRRAQLESINKNNDEARKLIEQALALKSDYTDALFFLVEIETEEGDIAGAIRQAERASELSPKDATVFFRLGLLRYKNGDYKGAASAFEAAVILNTSYWNARYYLGQAYQKEGRMEDALAQYRILEKFLPDNQDVKDAIGSLSKPAPSSSVETTSQEDTERTP
ncbi:MAG: tetratricopeptide repeat protein [Patescibacteria group bacterium]